MRPKACLKESVVDLNFLLQIHNSHYTIEFIVKGLPALIRI